MVHTAIENDKCDLNKRVQEDSQTQSPRIINDIAMNAIKNQGGIFSSMVGEVKVEMNHRVPMVEKMGESFANLFEINPLKMTLNGLSRISVIHWYLCALVVGIIMFSVSGKKVMFARAVFIILLGIGNILCALSMFKFVHLGGQQHLVGLMAEIRVAYANLADKVRFNKNNSSTDDSDVDIQIEYVEPQGLSTDGIAGLLLIVLSTGLGYAPKSGGLNAVKEYLRMSPVMKTNMLETISSTLSLLSDLFEKMNCPNFLGTIVDLPVTDTIVIEWVDKVNKFINDVSNNTDGSWDDNTIAYNSFIAESKIIERTLAKGSVSHVTLIDTVKSLERCKNAMNRRFTSLKGFRPEPVMVYLQGAPATMKSTLSGRLADILNRITLSGSLAEDYINCPDTYVYRRSTDKWWEGYTSKANITIIDDLFQMVDNGSTPSESEAADIIKMTNSEEFAVPMANADVKNTVFFRSNFIVATSNQFNPNLINSVHSKTAVRRRLHFFVNVCVNPKYKKYPNDPKSEEVDKTLLPLIEDAYGNGIPECTTLPTDFWLFTYNEVEGPVIPTQFEPVDYHTLVEKIVRKHYRHKKNFEVNRVMAQRTFKEEAQSIIDRLKPTKDQFMNLQEAISSNFLPKTYPMEIIGAYPQSGLHDDIDMISVDEDVQYARQITETKLFVQTYFNNLVSSVRMKLYHGFISLMFDIQNAGLWYENPIEDFLFSLSDEDSTKVKEFMEAHSAMTMDSEQFIFNLLSFSRVIMHFRQRNHIHVISGTPMTFEEKFNVKKNAFVTVMKDGLEYAMQNKLKVVMIATASATIVYALLRFVISINGDIEPQSAHKEGGIAKGPSRGKTTARRAAGPKPKETSVIISQSDAMLKTLLNGSSFKFDNRSAHKDVLTALIDKNQFIMYVHRTWQDKVTVRRIGHCINLRSNHFGMPFHFSLDLEDFANEIPLAKSYVTFTTASNSRKFSMDLDEFLRSIVSTEESEEKDFCLFTGGPEKLAKGAMHYFIDETDNRWKSKVLTPVSIIGSRQHGALKEHTSFRLVETHATLLKDSIAIKASWKTENNMTHYHMMNTLSYAGDFSAGDCGSIVVLKNDSLGSKIVVGLHVAGTSNTGYCNVINQKVIESLLDIVDFTEVIEEELEPQGLTRNHILHYDYLHPKMLVRGCFDSRRTVATCSRSMITKSVLYGKIPGEIGRVKEKPSLLFKIERDGVVIDPKEIALANYARFPPPLESEVVDQAVHSYFQIIGKNDNVKSDAKIVYDTKTALTYFGDHVKSIASNTSAGWPMNTQAEDDLKKLYFKSIHEDPELVEATLTQIETKVNEVEELYSQNIRPVFIYSDALKDETRPIQKVKEGKTRMFSGCPFILLIMFRRYFGSFIDYYFDVNIKVGSAIGINPYSEDWHELAQNLLKFSSNDNDLAIGAGDYSKFDCSESPLVLDGILDIIQAWYGKSGREQRIRQLLWLEITNSRHIFGGDYYEWSNGMPSGNPMTAIINTMYNQLAFRMAFHYCNLPIDKYNSSVYMCALGDDNVFCVHDEYRDAFNELTMVDAMKVIGLTYTTELKGIATVPFRRITEVEFLKRSFSLFKLNFMGGQKRYLAPIQMDTIINMLYWTKKGSNRDQISRDNVALALRELSFHGREKYDYYQPILLRLTEEFLPGVQTHHALHTDYRSVLRDTMNLEHQF